MARAREPRASGGPAQRGFTPREQQIMDIVYRLGEATAADIHSRMPDAPTYTTVRGLLRTLLAKQHLRVRDDGVRFIYSPRLPRKLAGTHTLAQVIRTFFAGSPADAMAAVLGSPDVTLSRAELRKLAALVEEAKAREKRT